MSIAKILGFVLCGVSLAVCYAHLMGRFFPKPGLLPGAITALCYILCVGLGVGLNYLFEIKEGVYIAVAFVPVSIFIKVFLEIKSERKRYPQ